MVCLIQGLNENYNHGCSSIVSPIMDNFFIIFIEKKFL